MRKTTLITTSTVLGAGFALAGLGIGTAGAATVEPQLVEGNPSCQDVLPGSTEYKLDFAPDDGEYSDGTIHVTIGNWGGSVISWTSDLDVDAVIMKGGPAANVYLYAGDADLADDLLVTPTNPDNEQPYGISHISFCYGVDEPGEEPEEPGDELEQPEFPDEPDQPADEPEQPVDEPEQPADEPEPEVLGKQVERPAQLPRTGAPTVVLAAAGAALTALGEGLRRLGKR